jgi:hypothetical protein
MQVSDLTNALENFRKLPFAVRLVFVAGCILLAANIALMLAQIPNVTWKIDPGLATLCGAVIGLWALAWQAGKGFKNLIRSQESQAEIERAARLHQAEIDNEKLERNENRKKMVLVAALWAEVASLYRQVGEAQVTSLMMKSAAESMKRDRIPNPSNRITFQTFDAPIFKANINHLGLLGASIAADVVTIASRATGKPFELVNETPPSFDIVITIYKGHAETLENWRDDLLHVANRLRSVMDGSADPGTLHNAQFQRKLNKKATS